MEQLTGGDIVIQDGSSNVLPPEVDSLEWFELYRPAPPATLDLAVLKQELTSIVETRIKRGARVGVAVGSRGVARIPEVVTAVVEVLRKRGVRPVLIPAMGSHGGATSSGQIGVLRRLGVEAEALGVPVDASMDVEEVGRLARGLPVFVSKAALQCDAVVPVNRVKPHTSFRAPVESGLTKMLTIGLGKERGASSLHVAGFDSFAEVLPEAAHIVRSVLEVPFGVALLEDQWHRLYRAEVVPGEEILQRDVALLKEAWARFARLPFNQVDILVLKEIGKTISGAGMDTNVTGRFPAKPLPAPTVIERLVVLDLREDSGGNAIGMGMADVVTERLRAKVDWAATYANARTAKGLAGAKLPIVAGTDVDALALAIASLVGQTSGQVRIVAMANTLGVDHLAVSEPLLADARAAGYALTAGPLRAEFTEDGAAARIGGLEFFGEPSPSAAASSAVGPS